MPNNLQVGKDGRSLTNRYGWLAGGWLTWAATIFPGETSTSVIPGYGICNVPKNIAPRVSPSDRPTGVVIMIVSREDRHEADEEDSALSPYIYT